MTDAPPGHRPRAVPRGRLPRFARLGGMASGVVGSAALEGARRWGRGDRAEWRDLLLSPGNVARVTEELARMRGAAMKVGQLVSMDAGELLPPELAQIMARLRAEADPMPPRQLRHVLDKAWGRDWLSHFRHFDPRPVAAASIGQVHRAETRDGRVLAIKVQYPGIRDSIASDVANVGALIRVSGLLPTGFDLPPLLDEATRQLHEEADYAREAEDLARFGALLSGERDFALPEVAPEFTTRDVLAMTYLDGIPIEEASAFGEDVADRVMARLAALALRELFEFRRAQTDPNFANYRYDAASDRIVLLDFGAVRAFSDDVAEGYRTLFRSGLAGEPDAIRQAAGALGLFGEDTAPHHVDLIVRMISTVFAALEPDRPFDFADPALTARMRELGLALGADGSFAHVPPVDTLHLQRKFAGLFLLGARLRARADLHAIAARFA